MRGGTNAVPSGVGLKVIATGTLKSSGAGITESSFSLPEPAQFVIICVHRGEDRGNAIVIMRYNEFIQMSNDGRGEYMLSDDGITITYRNLTSLAHFVAIG